MALAMAMEVAPVWEPAEVMVAVGDPGLVMVVVEVLALGENMAEATAVEVVAVEGLA